MNRTLRTLLLATTLVFGGCAAAPRPLRYAAVEMPNVVPPPPGGATHQVEVSKTRVLPNIRLPEDAAEFLRDLEKKAGTPVLRSVDLKLTTSICFLICVNTDTATAEAPN